MSLMRNLCLLSTTMLTAAALASPVLAQAKVTVLTIGYPDEDTTDAISGATAPGIGKLEAAFEAANPNIDLVITNIPWGSGAAPSNVSAGTAHSGVRSSTADSRNRAIFAIPASLPVRTNRPSTAPAPGGERARTPPRVRARSRLPGCWGSGARPRPRGVRSGADPGQVAGPGVAGREVVVVELLGLQDPARVLGARADPFRQPEVPEAGCPGGLDDEHLRAGAGRGRPGVDGVGGDVQDVARLQDRDPVPDERVQPPFEEEEGLG